MARKKASLGCLFWIALVLLVVVVFLFNRSAIEGVLERTDLVGILQRTFSSESATNQPSQPQSPPQLQTPAPPNREDSAAPSEQTSTSATDTDTEQLQAPPFPELTPVVQVGDPDRVGAEAGLAENGSNGDASSGTWHGVENTHQRRGRLYFVTVGDEGDISLHGLLRTIEYVDAPLTATLTELLSGPLSTELHQGYISLIPPGVELRQVAVRDSVAVIDFSAQFRFNRLGQEGLSAQLQQIVYSATEFPTVAAVQILIDGERVEYLAPEGLFVGDPIGRDSF